MLKSLILSLLTLSLSWVHVQADHDKKHASTRDIVKCIAKIDKQILEITKRIDATTQADLIIDQEILSIVSSLNDIVSCGAPIRITAQDFMDSTGRLSKTYVISQPGNYILCGNIIFDPAVASTPAIWIQAAAGANVQLNLNGQILSQINQTEAGVVGIKVDPGVSNVTIRNGTIRGFSQSGILAGDPTLTNLAPIINLKVLDIKASDNALNAVQIVEALGLLVHNLDTTGTAGGERMLQMTNCMNAVINRCSASNFTSTIGSILEINTCTNIFVQEVDINSNKKTITSSNHTSQQSSVVSIIGSNNVNLMRSSFNNNTNTTAVTSTFSILLFIQSPNCGIFECQVNSNVDTAGGTNTQDFLIDISGCDNFKVINSEANYNSCPVSIRNFIIVDAFNCSSLLFDSVQANYNSVAALAVNPTSSSSLQGMLITLSTTTTDPNNAAIIRNCQTNKNSVQLGGAGRGTANFGALEGLHVNSWNTIIDNHQASFNTLGDHNPNTDAVGIELGGFSSGSIIMNSSACFNTGGEESYGIVLDTDLPTISLAANRAILNCIASSNGNFGIDLNFPDTVGLPLDIVISDCMIGENGGNFGPAAGIFLRQLPNGIRNVFINNCHIHDTASSDSTNGNAAGIWANSINNLIIQDSVVLNTVPASSAFIGHGILLNSCSNAELARLQLNGNNDAGIELQGIINGVSMIDCDVVNNNIGIEFASTAAATCCLVQDCRAINNLTSGFVHAPTPLASTFIGNFAQCNGTTAAANYIINGGAIELQELSWSTGTTRLINGTQVLGSRLTNLRSVP